MILIEYSQYALQGNFLAHAFMSTYSKVVSKYLTMIAVLQQYAYILFVSTLIYLVSTQSSTPPAQVDALISLYNATEGPYWINTWNISSDPCNDAWYGIKCDSNNVYTLSLQNNNLNGEIPDLSALTYLQFLYLSNNILVGSIPSSLAITSMLQMGLDGNQLTGTIPSEFANLNLLQTLYLQNNQLSGGIDFLGNLTNAVYVYLSNNRLGGTISNSIASLFLLQQLGLDSNNFIGTIPSGFAQNQNYLTGFYGQNNQFSGVIDSSLPLCQSSILTCDLSNNDFSCPVPTPTCCQITQCSAT